MTSKRNLTSKRNILSDHVVQLRWRRRPVRLKSCVCKIVFRWISCSGTATNSGMLMPKRCVCICVIVLCVFVCFVGEKVCESIASERTVNVPPPSPYPSFSPFPFQSVTTKGALRSEDRLRIPLCHAVLFHYVLLLFLYVALMMIVTLALVVKINSGDILFRPMSIHVTVLLLPFSLVAYSSILPSLCLYTLYHVLCLNDCCQNLTEQKWL